MSLHLMLMGVDYAGSPTDGDTVPLGASGEPMPIRFSEQARLDGLEYLCDGDPRFDQVENHEAYAFLIEADRDGNWALTPHPQSAICQLTIDRGREWRDEDTAELQAFLQYVATGSPRLNEAIKKANEPQAKSYSDYVQSILKMVSLLRRAIGA